MSTRPLCSPMAQFCSLVVIAFGLPPPLAPKSISPKRCIEVEMHRFGLIDFGARGGGRPNAITTSEQNCAIGEQSGRVLMTARDHVSCGVEHAGRGNI